MEPKKSPAFFLRGGRCREALADQKLSVRAFELVDEMMLGMMVHGWTPTVS